MITCPHCGGSIDETRKVATHVTVNDNVTYRLGATSRGGTQIECIARDGLVHRVCYWVPRGITIGNRIHIGGEILHFHSEER